MSEYSSNFSGDSNPILKLNYTNQTYFILISFYIKRYLIIEHLRNYMVETDNSTKMAVVLETKDNVGVEDFPDEMNLEEKERLSSDGEVFLFSDNIESKLGSSHGVEKIYVYPEDNLFIAEVPSVMRGIPIEEEFEYFIKHVNFIKVEQEVLRSNIVVKDIEKMLFEFADSITYYRFDNEKVRDYDEIKNRLDKNNVSDFRVKVDDAGIYSSEGILVVHSKEPREHIFRLKEKNII